ncbi:FAD-binding oxidoreductase [Marinomonas agarivorans]|nr:FAD-binding oxidoreductase [Marinomonas agarivorans]
MIPKLSDISPTQTKYLNFLQQLEAAGFEGDIQQDYANRIISSTDNSIYQVLPQGVLYPKSTDDLIKLTKLAYQEEFKGIVLSPRGGGTGTNAQSLTDGLVVDLSKYMNKVLEINAKEGWARVQTGVVKDQLNAAAKEHNLFFAPELSTSNRATIGGMINTDASGQGSVVYGKTRDHVLELSTVLLDGSVLHSTPIDDNTLATKKQAAGYTGHIHRVVDNAFKDNQNEIDTVFPKLNRCLTGYDIAHIRTEDNLFDMNAVLCGSEGTLGFIVEAKVNLLPIPKHAILVNVAYDSFESSLRHANQLLSAGPTSIETIDSYVLNLAKEDNIWQSVAHLFPAETSVPVAGVNFVEYTGNNLKELKAKAKALTDLLTHEGNTSVLGVATAVGHDEVNKIWAMRKKSVGLLGNMKGNSRPVPFVEDTAVPPEKLADYIMEFRALLDAHKLQYGMFGHVDAGVLHVRPALDLKIAKNKKLIRSITDSVVELTQKYDGLLWGEHGKGVRSEYAPEFFGSFYPVIQQIKAAFDPHNQLNPSKIATPLEANVELLKIDKVPLRGQYDRQISNSNRDQFQEGLFCNGNGACYNFDPNDAMCPSWKITRERKHSPKGRASLMREWLRMVSTQEIDIVDSRSKIHSASSFLQFFPKFVRSTRKQRGEYDFSHEVHESMMGCLACKSCTGQCPIKVDVPDFRAKFLEQYYSRYFRPLRHHLIARLEGMLPLLARFPKTYNWFLEKAWVKSFLKNYIGLIDSPTLSTLDTKKEFDLRSVRFATPDILDKATPYDRHKLVIIIQDAFTSHFETQLVLDTMELLSRLGFNAFLAPYLPNGKPQHVHGFLKSFEKTATKHLDFLESLAKYNIPLVGIDPSMTMTYRSEYLKLFADKRKVPQVHLLQEWLVKQKDHLSTQPFALEDNTYHLLAHCTEATNAPAAIKDWQETFSLLGLSLKIENVGCCGMAGTYGHEAANLENSKGIYDLSWSAKVQDPELKDHIVATGYSCRSQVKRFDQQDVLHPLQALLKHLKETAEIEV